MNLDKNILKHTLGINSRQKISYRNYFAADPEGDDYDKCVALTKAGYMEQYHIDPESKLIFFRVTNNGKDLLGIKHE